MKRKVFKQLACSVAVSVMLAAAPGMPENIPNAAVTAEAKAETPAKLTTVRLNKISSPSYNKVTINWGKVSGATNYVIYYKKPGNSWRKITTVGASKLSYTHIASKSFPITVGQKYTYTVRAYNKNTKKYSPYNTKGLTISTKPTKSKVNEVGLTGNNKVVRVRWEYAAGCIITACTGIPVRGGLIWGMCLRLHARTTTELLCLGRLIGMRWFLIMGRLGIIPMGKSELVCLSRNLLLGLTGYL